MRDATSDVLVIGVGYTGRRVLERLPRAAATGLGRTAVRSSRRTATLDLDVDDVLPVRPAGRYAVLYTVPPAPRASNDARLERLLDSLAPPPARFVYISTTGVYGDRDGGVVDEATPPRPVSARARRRVASERTLTEWCAWHDVALVILRVPAIYGPGRLGIERIRSGEPVLAEADANPGNRIHVDDLAGCCIRALADDVPAGIYNIGDGDWRSSSWFAREVARQAGLEPPAEISRAEAEQRFSAARLSFLAEARRVDTRKMREVLGVTPRYSRAEDGIRASLGDQTD